MKHVDHGYDIEVIRVLKELAGSGVSRPIHFQPPGDYLLDGVRYHSRPEAACGFFLEHFISDFSLRYGRTFQVPVGVGVGGDLQTVDFRHEQLFIEYHPPRVHQRRGRKSGGEPKELRMLRGVLRKPGLSRRAKDRAYARLRAYLTRRYVEERMNVLSNSPVVSDFHLVVLGSPEELYRDLLQPFSSRKLPPLKLFLKDFKAILREVIDVREMDCARTLFAC